MQRQLVPVLYRSIGLSNIGRRSYLDYDDGSYSTPRHDPTAVDRVGRFPSQVRMQPTGKVLPLHIVIKSSDTEGQFRHIAKIFDPINELQYLIAEDCDGGRRRLSCVAQQMIIEDKTPAVVTIPLWAPSPYWEDESSTTLTDTIDAITNPIVFAPFNNGSAYAYPFLTATPTAQRTASQGYTRMREVIYANTSEYALTGPASGTWLLEITSTLNPLAEAGWDTAALVAGGEMQSDGRDIAIFVDGIKLPDQKVNIADMNTAVTKIWIEISDAPALVARNRDAIGAAVNTTITFHNAQHGFKGGDYLVWFNSAGDVEKSRVTNVAGAVVSVTRQVHNAAAPAATVVETPIFRSGHRIQIAWGWTGATARPTNDNPPLIDLTTSKNSAWEWTDVPIWADGNSRPGGWRRILYEGREDNPELIKNKLSAKTVLKVYDPSPGLPNSGDEVNAFFDMEPDAGGPNFDALEFRACCGIDNTAPSIEYDAYIGWPFAFQIIGRDLLGLDSIVASRYGFDSVFPAAAHFPPIAYVNQVEQPAGVLSAVIMRGRQMILTTCRPGDGTVESLSKSSAVGVDAQGFHIEETSQLIGIVLRGRTTGALNSSGFFPQINQTGLPGGSTLASNPGPGAVIIGPFSGASPLTTMDIVVFNAGLSAAFTTDIPVMAPGEYFLIIVLTTASTSGLEVPKSFGSIYALGSHWNSTTPLTTVPPTWLEVPDEDLWFALLSLNADNQDDAVQANRTGEFILFHNEKLTFDVNRTPFVDARPAEDAYYMDTQWSQGSDVMRLRYLKRWADAQGNPIEINVAERTVVDKAESSESIRQCLSVADDPWLHIRPAANSISVQSLGGTGGELHTLEFRSAWQA